MLCPLSRSHLALSVENFSCQVLLLRPDLTMCVSLEHMNGGAGVLQCNWALTQGFSEYLCGDCIFLETLVCSHKLQIKGLLKHVSCGKLP